MSTRAAEGEREDTAPPVGEVLAGAQVLWRALRGLTHAHARLASLEMRLAGESLVTMIAAGMVAGLLLASAWLVLVAALVLALINAGMSPFLALGLAVLLNLFVAYQCRGLAQRRSLALGFPATLRSLGASEAEVS